MATVSTYMMAVQIAENFWSLPATLNSTNVGDKIMKCALQVLPCNKGVQESFSDAITVYGMLGFVTTVKWLKEQTSWWDKKAIGKCALLGAQSILFYKGVEKLGLLAVIGLNMGKFSIFTIVHPLLTASVVKDLLIGVSAGFSVLVGWEKQAEYKPTVNDEIALTADKAKIAFLSLSIASTFKIVDFSTILVTTSYGVLTMGMFANLVGATFAICALSKAIADYKREEAKKIGQ